ncbi:MAG: alpha/beta hydrolase [Steroidobacteraceae bacterium]|nr:alpha/beta hydrolase [Steroidobacteraceae bacterium]
MSSITNGPSAVHAHLSARARELAAADPADLARIRTIIDALAIDSKPLAGVKFVQSAHAAIRGVWAVPENADPDRRIVYCHGCSFMAGSLDLYSGVVSRLAVLARACVFFVEYRLAPEHRFPCAADDCLRAFHWARTNGPDGEGRAAACFLVGDSSGAALTIAIALDAARAGASPDGIVTLSPFVDLSVSGDANDGRDPLTTREMAMACASIYAPGMDPRDPRLSPLFADLSALAPIQIHGATQDPLLDDALRLAKRARKAGARVELHVWSDVPHAWYLFPTELPEASLGLELAATFLRRL